MQRLTAPAAQRLTRTLALTGALLLAALPAGAGADDVVVAQDGSGKVTLNGDLDGNDITITQSGGSITITGNGGTTVDGKPSVTIAPPPNVTEIETRLRGGDDTVTVDGVSVEDLDIKDEQGNNTTTVRNGTVKDKLKIRHGAGDDTVTVTDTTRKREAIKTDGGRDTVDVAGGSSQRSTWHTQSGADTVSLVDTSVGVLNLNTGAGDDDVSVDGSQIDWLHGQGASGANCLIDGLENHFGWGPGFRGFDPQACNGEPPTPTGRAVTLDYDTGDLPAGTVLCLDEIAAGGCTFAGPECLEGGSPALHLHDWIAILSIPDVLFDDPDPSGCGHGIVRDGVPGCGPDTVPPCIAE